MSAAHAPVDDEDLCRICDAAIEEPRVAVGLKTCWPCGVFADPGNPPWRIDQGASERDCTGVVFS